MGINGGWGSIRELGERSVTVTARNGDYTGVGGSAPLLLRLGMGIIRGLGGAPPRGHAGTVFRLVGYAGTNAGMAGQEARATVATFILATHQG